MNEDGTAIYSILAEDEDLHEILVLFVDELPERIALFENSFQRKDWEELRRVAHQFKGSSGSYGFRQLSPAAAELEQAVKNGAPEDLIESLMNKLIDLCRRATADQEPS